MNGARLFGEAIGEISSATPERAGQGFRFFKKLLDSLSKQDRFEAEYGLTSYLHELTMYFTTDPMLQSIIGVTAEPAEAVGERDCEESGDAPSQSLLMQQHPSAELPRLFGLFSLLNLSFMRVSEASHGTLLCIDLCVLAGAVAKTQLYYAVLPSSSNAALIPNPVLEGPVTGDMVVHLFTNKDWLSLMYQVFELFTQNINHFVRQLSNLNSSLISRAWSIQSSPDNRISLCRSIDFGYISSDDVENFGCYLSYAIESVLTLWRQLLEVDSRLLPCAALRSVVLEGLMTAAQAIVKSSAPKESAVPRNHHVDAGYANGSDLSEEDEIDEHFHQFLLETNQIVPT